MVQRTEMIPPTSVGVAAKVQRTTRVRGNREEWPSGLRWRGIPWRHRKLRPFGAAGSRTSRREPLGIV